MRSVVGLVRAEKPGPFLLAQSEAVALDDQDVAVVKHAVEDRVAKVPT
jgi:hypothetical protein